MPRDGGVRAVSCALLNLDQTNLVFCIVNAKLANGEESRQVIDKIMQGLNAYINKYTKKPTQSFLHGLMVSYKADGVARAKNIKSIIVEQGLTLSGVLTILNDELDKSQELLRNLRQIIVDVFFTADNISKIKTLPGVNCCENWRIFIELYRAVIRIAMNDVRQSVELKQMPQERYSSSSCP